MTTVPERAGDLLPRTLASLAAAGFDQPLVSLDDRIPRRGNFANWWLCALEVYLRDRHADMYAVFEDDVIMSLGAREYLERTCREGSRGYYNLYTSSENERRVKSDFTGWFMSTQGGLGALGLVFCADLFKRLLTDSRMIQHSLHPERGMRKVDGAISICMSHQVVLEWCHQPSIVEHTGGHASMIGNTGIYSPSSTFRGEQFDLRGLL